MDIFADFRARIASVMQSRIEAGALPAGLDVSRFTVEPTRDAAHGDLATNAAMVYAREAKEHYKTPRQFAVALAASLAGDPDIDTAEVAGPGFINITLQPAIYTGVIRAVLRDGVDFGRRSPEGDPVNVEFVSANPTGPLHVGHGRGAVFGDALANLLVYAGRPTTREYYINDAGAQVDVLARSAFLRYREALGEAVGPVPEGLYPGDYLKPVGEALARQYGPALREKHEAEWLPLVRETAIAAMMATIRDDLAALDIEHETFFSERSLTQPAADGGLNPVDSAIEDLRRRGFVYQGRLAPPKGQAVEDWEDREQTLFRSTDFGDDVDRALLKSDGSYTYFASDIAYHKTKLDRGYTTLIDVLGADHGGYVKRMQAVVAALSDRRAALDVKLCQLVKLVRDGEPVKMSKRSGDFVTLREVVDEVGRDAVRFMMLFRSNDAALEFDLRKVIEQSKDNPVFYVQYAHARGRSVLRQAGTVFPDADFSAGSLASAALELLTDTGEIALVKIIAQYPRLIGAASSSHEPHRVAFYLHDLASSFHAHWNRGKDQPQLRFVNEERRDLTNARLALVVSLTAVLASGLGLLGVTAPEEMR